MNGDALLRHEAHLRRAPDPDAAMRLIVDTGPALLGCERAFLFRPRRGRWRLHAATGVSEIEPNAPAVRALEAGPDEGGGVRVELVDRKGCAFARVAFPNARSAEQRATAETLAEVWSQALLALGCRAPRRAGRRTVLLPVVGGAALLALVLVRVPVMTLAPYEIVAREPVPVTAPLDGVVEGLDLEPDALVRAGQRIGAIDPRDLRAELSLAQGRLDLAAARLETARQTGFRTGGSGSDVILARAEHAVAASERDIHGERLRRTVLKAPRAGVLLHDGRDRWRGRPVRAGERIARIANPDDVEAAIELAVSDATQVREGAPVRLFPDGALRSLAARVSRVSYLPRATADGRLVYPVAARPDGTPRIGARGTARIAGERVPLAVWLGRRPWTALRQRMGW